MSKFSDLDALIQEDEDDAYTVGIVTKKTIGGFVAWTVTSAERKDGKTSYYSEEGCNFGRGRTSLTRAGAIRNLKEHLEDYPCGFKFVPLKDIFVWDLDKAVPWTPSHD